MLRFHGRGRLVLKSKASSDVFTYFGRFVNGLRFVHQSSSLDNENNVQINEKQTIVHQSSSLDNGNNVRIKEKQPEIPWLVLPGREARDTIDSSFSYCLYNVKNQEFAKNINGEESIFSPLDKNLRIVGSSHGCLSFIDRENCKLMLSRPYWPNGNESESDRNFVFLPPIETLPTIAGTLVQKSNADGCMEDVGLILNSYYGEQRFESYMRLSELLVSKIIFSSAPPRCLWDPQNMESSESCDVLMATNGHAAKTKLAYCRLPDNGCQSWTELEYDRWISDIVYRKQDGKFYSVSYGYCQGGVQIVSWDLRSDAKTGPKLKTTELVPSKSFPKFSAYEERVRDRCSFRRNYLVESAKNGKLLLVMRYIAERVADDGTILDVEEDEDEDEDEDEGTSVPYRTVRFDVFEVDLVKERLKYIENLGREALFVGVNHSFALPVSENQCQVEANSIYFTDHNSIACPNVQCRNQKFGGHDFGVYNLESKAVKPCYKTESVRFMGPPAWFAPPSI